MAQKNERELERIDTPVFEQALATVSGTRPVYAGTYDDRLSEIMEQMASRPAFEYDVNKDSFYKQMKDRYIQQGKLAMKDSMGKAAALTGGYGSTYGQQVGQQTFDAYLQDLGDNVPELYEMAYRLYSDEGDALRDQFSIIGALRDEEYGRYRDDLGDWEYAQEVERQREQEEYERQQDALDREAYDKEFAYQQQQDAYARLYATITGSGYVPTDQELAAAGMSRGEASALYSSYQQQMLRTSGYGGGSSSGRGSSSGGGGSGYDANVAAMQQQLNAMGAGLAVDGIWGPKTQAAYDRLMGGGGGGAGTYNMGELADAAAGGASKTQIEQALAARGVDVNDKYVQADIKWAMSK